ncbi:MAG: GerMN domain-containing protein [Treponema sp.]|nr:GerMN domain-containing protein [Candidatus Treponema caballi]
MGDDKKKKHVGASAFFWLIFALILLIAFLINRNKIIDVLQRTGFFSKVFGTEPAFVMNHQTSDDNEPVAELSSVTIEEPYADTEPEIVLIPQNNKFMYSDEPEEVTPPVVEEKKIIPAVQPPVQSVEDESVPKMTQHLCFVVISGDGSVLRKEIERQIPKTMTPLTAAINALLVGPNIDELEKGYMTLIPEGTQLLGASVKDGVANINFSSAFRFNKYGVEGYYGQLAQIVYTATAFSNINSVQFLIEGEKIEYLSEGVFIGAPLSRTSLY